MTVTPLLIMSMWMCLALASYLTKPPESGEAHTLDSTVFSPFSAHMSAISTTFDYRLKEKTGYCREQEFRAAEKFIAGFGERAANGCLPLSVWTLEGWD